MTQDLKNKLQQSLDAMIPKHGGKRKHAGPKKLPKGEHKIQIQVGIERDFIDEWGGIKKLQKDIKEWIYSMLKL